MYSLLLRLCCTVCMHVILHPPPPFAPTQIGQCSRQSAMSAREERTPTERKTAAFEAATTMGAIGTYCHFVSVAPSLPTNSSARRAPVSAYGASVHAHSTIWRSSDVDTNQQHATPIAAPPPPPSLRPPPHRCCDCSRRSTCSLSKSRARTSACACKQANRPCTSCACLAHCRNTSPRLPTPSRIPPLPLFHGRPSPIAQPMVPPPPHVPLPPTLPHPPDSPMQPSATPPSAASATSVVVTATCHGTTPITDAATLSDTLRGDPCRAPISLPPTQPQPSRPPMPSITTLQSAASASSVVVPAERHGAT